MLEYGGTIVVLKVHLNVAIKSNHVHGSVSSMKSINRMCFLKPPDDLIC